MIQTPPPNQCCGCLVCSIVCPQKCIERTEDDCGFVMPLVDASRCVQCGMCEQICPIQQKYPNPSFTSQKIYASYSKDTSLRKRASSGGIFETIAQIILAKGGSVFGCKFDENLQLRMCEATTIEQVRELTKSKYIQSDCHNLFPFIKQRLEEGKYVLVCATPCQIAALKNYLGSLSQYSQLFLMDFFCHGVPSQQLFDKCRRYVQNKRNTKWKSYNFRFKPTTTTIHYANIIEQSLQGKEKQNIYFYFEDPFYLGFEKYLTLRDSCYHCPFGNGNHQADITVGDLHETEKYWPEANRFKGVSKVVINTLKGDAMWQKITPTLCVHELPSPEIFFTGPEPMPVERKFFIQDLKTLPFEQVVNKWMNPRKEWTKAIYYRLPDWIRLPLKESCLLGKAWYRRIKR